MKRQFCKKELALIRDVKIYKLTKITGNKNCHLILLSKNSHLIKLNN